MVKGKDKGPANYSIHPGVSISKELHIIYKLINILITVQNAERSINKNYNNKRNYEYQTPKPA